jgi:hypothetical protein
MFSMLLINAGRLFNLTHNSMTLRGAAFSSDVAILGIFKIALLLRIMLQTFFKLTLHKRLLVI